MLRRRLLITLLTLAALPAGLALADGEDDTTFDGDGAVYLESETDASQPVVARASDGDLLVGTAISRATKNDARGEDPVFEVELRVYKLDEDGGLDDTWGGDGIASAEFGLDGNTASQALALRGLPDGGALLVADDSGTDGIAAARFDSAGTGEVIRPPGLQGCGQPPELAEILADGDVLAFWDNSCVGPTNPCATRGLPQPCLEVGRARYQRYDLVDDALNPVNGAHGVGLTPLGDDMFIDDVAVDAAGQPSILGDVIPAPQGRGSREEDTVILRFDADDEPDNSLDGDGVAVLEGEGYEDTYTGRFGLRPGGGYVVALDDGGFDERGQANTWELARLEASGALDPDFGGGGFAEPNHEAFTCPFPHSVRVLADERILLFRDNQDDSPTCADGAVVARLTTAGALDPAFDGDGVRTFDLGGDNVNLSAENADPLPLADGRVVLPFFLSYFPDPSRVAPPTDSGQYLALFRLKGPPAQEEEQEEVKPAAQAASSSVTAASVALPARPVVARRCTSRRSLRIRLRTGRKRSERSPIVSAVVRVNGRRVRAVRNGASVNLRNLPKGRYTVRIRLRLKDGGIVNDVRRYRTCTPKIESTLAPLRTRRPR